MNVKERLQRYIDYKGISVRAFERAAGLAYGYVANIRKSILPERAMSIAKHFPDLNIGWVLTGEGGMLRAEQDVPTSSESTGTSILDSLIAANLRLANAAEESAQTARLLAESISLMLNQPVKGGNIAAVSSPGPVMRAAR